MLHIRPILGNCQIFAQRRQGPIELKLLTAIILLSGGGEDLDDYSRIYESIVLVVGVQYRLASDYDVGIGEQPVGSRSYSGIPGGHSARLALELLPELRPGVHGNPGMSQAGAHHANISPW
jgi:hypothetical protein